MAAKPMIAEDAHLAWLQAFVADAGLRPSDTVQIRAAARTRLEAVRKALAIEAEAEKAHATAVAAADVYRGVMQRYRAADVEITRTTMRLNRLEGDCCENCKRRFTQQVRREVIAPLRQARMAASEEKERLLPQRKEAEARVSEATHADEQAQRRRRQAVLRLGRCNLATEADHLEWALRNLEG